MNIETTHPVMKSQWRVEFPDDAADDPENEITSHQVAQKQPAWMHPNKHDIQWNDIIHILNNSNSLSAHKVIKLNYEKRINPKYYKSEFSKNLKTQN